MLLHSACRKVRVTQSYTIRGVRKAIIEVASIEEAMDGFADSARANQYWFDRHQDEQIEHGAMNYEEED